ncbi:MAG: LCP family protein [Candidatus Gracilibacteria bacterium]
MSDKSSFNILIAGKSGSLLDTMIFVHIEEKNRRIKMVSIPRDLFYNGRKINAFASMYGLAELKKVLSEISGYKIDKYIVIEMYAFMDVVDLVGGVDVHLDKPLIDPTYKTIDNGVEGTLHYEPGDYHFGGKEALRVARSRHTSSDFDRAARQQLILKALQTKARNLGVGDTDTLYEIVKTVLARTETDISPDEAIAYFFRYQNYEIASNAVISSGNVLYVPPYISEENCQVVIASAVSKGESVPSCGAENHAYTLLPKDDNWDAIKWFFSQQFN